MDSPSLRFPSFPLFKATKKETVSNQSGTANWARTIKLTKLTTTAARPGELYFFRGTSLPLLKKMQKSVLLPNSIEQNNDGRIRFSAS